MIKNIRHRGLKRLYERGDHSRIRAEFVERVEDILFRLDAATTIDDLKAPGFGLHPLKGNMKGYWSVSVSKNWRITFRFKDGDVLDVNYEDYH